MNAAIPSTNHTSSARFSIWNGGPLHRLEHALGTVRHDRGDPVRRALSFAAVAWLPLVLLGAWEAWSSGTWDPVLLVPSTHGRWLVFVPLLFLAECWIDDRLRHVLECLRESRVVVGEDLARLDRICERVERARDSSMAEGLVFFAALLGFARHVFTMDTPAQWWAVAVSALLSRFLLLRFLYRWSLWIWMCWRLSRLDLRLEGAHPDGAGGLGILQQPSRAFGLVVAGGSVLLSSDATARLLRDEATLALVANVLLVYVLLALGVALLPLFPFNASLRRCKREALDELAVLGAHHASVFRRKWLVTPTEDPVGTPDISSFADLGSGFRHVEEMSTVPMSRRLLAQLVIAAVLPSLPVVATTIPVTEVATRLFKVLL